MAYQISSIANFTVFRYTIRKTTRECSFHWYDIMRLAAYRQHNPKIPPHADCCTTGRLKRGYGVEPMLRLLSGDRTYQETHNAVLDAVDELGIMRLMGRGLEEYQAL